MNGDEDDDSVAAGTVREREAPSVGGPDRPPGGDGSDSPDDRTVRNWTVLLSALALLSLVSAAAIPAIHGTETTDAAVGSLVLALGFGLFLLVVRNLAPHLLVALDDVWTEHRPHVALATGFFGLGILVGVALVAAGVDLTELILELFEDEFGDELDPQAEGDPFELTATFFIVNNTPPFLMSIFGALTLGLVTVLIMVLNGVLVGNLAVVSGLETGFGPILALLVPHGVFELPALFVAAGVGFRFVHRASQRLLGTREALFTREYLLGTGLLVLLAWLVLVLAAFVEAYLTIPIAEFLFDI
ncbi:stage II sporulation protein M [Halobacteria archaeon AArc-dxtr1]|nr:stage II sporulation protein M [Halobacteria archaeon AArc-dxtr1]